MRVLRSRAGMTLIEVLISVAILATLMTLAARTISQAVKSKTKIQEQIDDVSKVRDALRLIERDVNLAYHQVDFEKELQDLIKKKNTQTATTTTGGRPPTPTPPTPEIPRKTERHDPSTHFMGSSESMSFVTMNTVHMVRDAREADFIEVGYELRDCTSATGKGSSKCLWRRSSPFVDGDVTKGGVEVVLLENVTEFGLKYIGKGKQDWVTEWKTEKGGDATTKNNFPQAVQISLTVEKDLNGKRKKVSMQIVAGVHFPNNKEPANDSNQKIATPE